MAFEVYDFRNDVRNVVIMPEIRSRFLRMEPGEIGPRHSHDLGQEVFLVLSGQCEFEIEGHIEVLGPGQMCFAAAHEMHQVRVIGDEPMTMYLSVTPHIEPTHTFWDDQGNQLPPRYGDATERERSARTDPVPPPAELAARQVAAAQALAAAATTSAAAQDSGARAWVQALADGDRAAAKAAVDGMWAGLLETFQAARTLGDVWNDLAATVAAESPRK